MKTLDICLVLVCVVLVVMIAFSFFKVNQLVASVIFLAGYLVNYGVNAITGVKPEDEDKEEKA